MSYYAGKYDIAVIGAGHAGCEAAQPEDKFQGDNYRQTDYPERQHEHEFEHFQVLQYFCITIIPRFRILCKDAAIFPSKSKLFVRLLT